MQSPHSGRSDHDLQPGTRLGRYTIVSHLATGGMAEIYLARASGIQGFERLVVVKRILPHWAQDPHFVEMFLDEARLAATLQHPNIAQVFDIGEHDLSYFFTMEYVHGCDARELFRKTQKANERIPLEHTLEIIVQAAGGLHYAHEQCDTDGNTLGIVHRDVSPSNILVTYDGGIKVCDFGVAKAAGRSRETSTGTLKGKISYMSPEQCRAEPLDRRSDVFGLGIVLWELLTGERLFEGDTDLAVLQLIVGRPAKRPSEVHPGFSPILEDVVMKALAQDPDDRHQTAEELQSDLERFAHHHKLMTSGRALGRYMKELFPDKLAAWEAAQREGKTLAAHLVETNLHDLTPSGLISGSGVRRSDAARTAATRRIGSNPPLGGSNPPLVDAPAFELPRELSEPVFTPTPQPASTTPRPEPDYARPPSTINSSVSEIGRPATGFPEPKSLGRRLLGWIVLLVASAGLTVAIIQYGLPLLNQTDEAPAPEQTPQRPGLSEETEALKEAGRQAEKQRAALDATREKAAEETAELERLREERNTAVEKANNKPAEQASKRPPPPETKSRTPKEPRSKRRRSSSKEKVAVKDKPKPPPADTEAEAKRLKKERAKRDRLKRDQEKRDRVEKSTKNSNSPLLPSKRGKK